MAMKHVFAPCIMLILLSVLSGPARPQPAAPPSISPITFAPGSPVSTVNGQMVLGGRDLYSLSAKPGQTLLVFVASEGEVTFEVYRPDATIAKAADGKVLIQGKTLPNAGSDDHAKAWVGTIPRSGNYLIAVGMPENGPVLSPYSLSVSLQ